MYLNKKLFLIFLVTILLIAVSSVDKNTAYGNKDMPLSKGHPKNVILMIADGYSTAYATNYRLYKDQESLLDPYLSGMVKTYSASSEITDSAASLPLRLQPDIKLITVELVHLSMENR